jgi:hypothetical protein
MEVELRMNDSTSAPTILCIASFFKGNDFIREATAQGVRVDPEIVLRVVKPNHVGLIIRTKRHQRMIELLEQYVARFSQDFTAVIPAEERAEQHL